MIEKNKRPDPLAWWNGLEAQWQLAFSQVAFNQRELHTPSPEEILDLLTRPVLRFASRDSQYPNMSVDLTNLSGLVELKELELLFVQNHPISSLEEIASLTQLKQLIVSGNQLTSLRGIEGMLQLEKLYAQGNQLTSIEEIGGLTQLEELLIFENPLPTLDGISSAHQGKLQQLTVRPNPHLSAAEILRVEQMLTLSIS